MNRMTKLFNRCFVRLCYNQPAWVGTTPKGRTVVCCDDCRWRIPRKDRRRIGGRYSETVKR